MLRRIGGTVVAGVVVAACLAGGAGCDRDPARVGEPVIVTLRHGVTYWHGRACGTLFPRLRSIDYRRRQFVVYCPDRGDVEVPTAATPTWLDELEGHVAWGFPYVVWAVAAIALVPLLTSLSRRWRDPFGVEAARAHLAAVAASEANAPPPPAPLAPLTCPTCGTPAVLADAPTVTCRGCGGAVPVPDAYRAPARLHAASARDFAAAAHALRWAGRIRRVNGGSVALVLTAAVVFEAQAAAWGLVYGLISDGYFSLVLPFLIGCGVLVVTWWRATLRRAPAPPIGDPLPPAPADDGTPTCATCGAPLDLPPASFVVVPCLYCGTQHLLGARADRRRVVAAVRAERAAGDLLAATTALRAEVRRLTRGVQLASWVFVGGALFGFAIVHPG
jgi:DNA-directed RNA polymerase subunit RPC12/RpoP